MRWLFNIEQDFYIIFCKFASFNVFIYVIVCCDNMNNIAHTLMITHHLLWYSRFLKKINIKNYDVIQNKKYLQWYTSIKFMVDTIYVTKSMTINKCLMSLSLKLYQLYGAKIYMILILGFKSKIRKFLTCNIINELNY